MNDDAGFFFPYRFTMASLLLRVLRATLIASLIITGFMLAFLVYRQSFPSLKCYSFNGPAVRNEINKPVMLLWFWPENKKFDFQDCKTLLQIDSCHLTDDRSLYSRARGVLIFHKAIQEDLSNLPPSPRPRLQRWIWFNMDTPDNTRRIKGLDGLFNLTMSYRKNADIHVRWRLTIKKNTSEVFVLPKKERLLCWVVDSKDLNTTSGKRYSYYRELAQHINVDIFDSSSDDVKGENYFLTISSCKFYLSFEDSIHRDYITETFNGPLAAGTVPIVLGPPRANYEDFAPGSSFIHVNDFPTPVALAEHLQKLDKDDEAYIRYFDWRQFYSIRRHLTEEKHKFAHAICQACHYITTRKEYRVVPDLYKWLLA